MAVTLRDIAERAGVSVAVVSQVLRDLPAAQRFRPETRNRIVQAAADLDFKPNFFAARIQGQNRKVVMLCVGALYDPYAGAIAHAFGNAISEQGYSLLVSALDRKESAAFIQDAVGPHGILMLAVVGYSSRSMLPDPLLETFARHGVHVVTIGRPAPTNKISEVTYDNRAAMENVVAHLPQTAQRIWLLGKPETEDPAGAAPPRCVATVEAIARLRPTARVSTIEEVPAATSAESSRLTIEAALRTFPPPDAVICFYDQSALGVIRALTQAGLQVGRDVAVTGFNDDPVSAFLSPPLTTVRIPVEELGRRAAQVLIDRFSKRLRSPARIKVETTLMERESSCLGSKG